MGFNVLSRVTFPQLEISMFDSQSFNERFRSDFIAAMAAEGALVQPGISTRHPLIHRIFSGSVVVESSLGFESQQSAQIFQARVDGAPTVVFEKMAAYGDIVSDSATFQVLNSDYVVPSDDKTEWYEEAGFFWAAVALGLAMFLCCCFGGLMYCWNWSKANLGDDYRDKETDNEGGMFASLPECPTPACPASLSTCCGLLGKKDQVRFVDCIFGGGCGVVKRVLCTVLLTTPEDPVLSAIFVPFRACCARGLEASRAISQGNQWAVGRVRWEPEQPTASHNND